MAEESVIAFFDALIEDELEKKIIKMIAQELDTEKIVEQLLNELKEKKNDRI